MATQLHARLGALQDNVGALLQRKRGGCLLGGQQAVLPLVSRCAKTQQRANSASIGPRWARDTADIQPGHLASYTQSQISISLC